MLRCMKKLFVKILTTRKQKKNCAFAGFEQTHKKGADSDLSPVLSLSSALKILRALSSAQKICEFCLSV